MRHENYCQLSFALTFDAVTVDVYVDWGPVDAARRNALPSQLHMREFHLCAKSVIGEGEALLLVLHSAPPQSLSLQHGRRCSCYFQACCSGKAHMICKTPWNIPREVPALQTSGWPTSGDQKVDLCSCRRSVIRLCGPTGWRCSDATIHLEKSDSRVNRQVTFADTLGNL